MQAADCDKSILRSFVTLSLSLLSHSRSLSSALLSLSLCLLQLLEPRCQLLVQIAFKFLTFYIKLLLSLSLFRHSMRQKFLPYLCSSVCQCAPPVLCVVFPLSFSSCRCCCCYLRDFTDDVMIGNAC